MLDKFPSYLQRALECMQIVRRQAAATLNYADTLPNCLRIAYHDSSERNSTSPGGCVPMALTCEMAGSDRTGFHGASTNDSDHNRFLAARNMSLIHSTLARSSVQRTCMTSMRALEATALQCRANGSIMNELDDPTNNPGEWLTLYNRNKKPPWHAFLTQHATL